VDLGEILRVMRSRWYIVVPMLLLAAGLGVGAYVVVPTSYTTYTMVSLLSSPAATTTATQGQDNPFLNFNGSLTATADFLGRRLQSTDVALELKNAGVTEKYEVALAENAQGPFLTLTVTGTDKQHILDSAATLAKMADTKLFQIQEQNGVSARDRIRLTQVIPPQKPQAELKKKIEVIIAAAGGTVALTFVLTFIVESTSRARRRRALAQDASPAESRTVTIETSDDRSAAVGRRPIPAQRAPLGDQERGAVADETRVLQLQPPSRHTGEPEPPAGTVEADKTAVIPIPLRGDRHRQAPADEPPSRGKGVAPVAGPPRIGSTYQSKSTDRRGQDANRINGN